MANCSTFPGVEVLRRAHTVSVKALITVSQLRWAGHVRQMANSRLPKAVFYSQLRQGKRSHEGQKLRFIEAAYEGNWNLAWYLGVGCSLESQMVRAVEEGHFSRRRSAPEGISACTCPTTLGSYLKQFPMQQLSALLQIPSGSDCPRENLFKIGLNSISRQSS